MNCIYCGKPIEEHRAGEDTDECVADLMGNDILLPRYSIIAMPSVVANLTADDNPVESVMMFWDRSNYRWAIELNMMCKPGSQEWSHYSVTADTRPLALCRAVLTLEAVEEAEALEQQHYDDMSGEIANAFGGRGR